MSDSKRRIPDAMAVADCDDLRRSYSDLPIGSSVHWATHPDAMASTARLFGLKPAPLQHCRVLELGCACGGNVVPIANGLPESRCVGIDISDVQIQKAQRLAEQLGVTNVELRAANIFDLNSEIGEFDYVICDGVFSWVPEAVQERILQICAQCLSENGIAYLSFNAYPGWHVRGTVREMLRFQTRNCTSDRDKISAARRLLLQLKESVAREDSPLNHLREEIELLRNSRDSYLFHEHLVEHNTPFYLTDFVEAPARMLCNSSRIYRFVVLNNFNSQAVRHKSALNWKIAYSRSSWLIFWKTDPITACSCAEAPGRHLAIPLPTPSVRCWSAALSVLKTPPPISAPPNPRNSSAVRNP